MWQLISTYVKPTREWDFDFPKALFFSPKTGIVIGICILEDADDCEYMFQYDSNGFELEPTHWMPLPSKPIQE